ncbi:MAG TPA: hypothetical protein VN408_25505 [Actinoplanes sp.]|nr:hypothetical protein [Actinoplanes sp.]
MAGWALGAPAGQPAALGVHSGLGDSAGEGGIGSAPIMTGPDHGTGRPAESPRTTADPDATADTPLGGPTVVVTTVTVIRTAAPETIRTTPPPALTEPPVPTPTEVTDPPGPSDTPPMPSSTTDPAEPEPSGFVDEETRYYHDYRGPGWWRFR